MLPFSIQIRSGLPIHQQVVFAVHKARVSGQLKTGDRFPSVKNLSKELRINPNTAHKIIASLINDGVLEVRPGIGTIITEPPELDQRAKQALVETELERIVVEAKRHGLSFGQLTEALKQHWETLDDKQQEPKQSNKDPS